MTDRLERTDLDRTWDVDDSLDDRSHQRDIDKLKCSLLNHFELIFSLQRETNVF